MHVCIYLSFASNCITENMARGNEFVWVALVFLRVYIAAVRRWFHQAEIRDSNEHCKSHTINELPCKLAMQGVSELEWGRGFATWGHINYLHRAIYCHHNRTQNLSLAHCPTLRELWWPFSLVHLHRSLEGLGDRLCSLHPHKWWRIIKQEALGLWCYSPRPITKLAQNQCRFRTIIIHKVLHILQVLCFYLAV